MPRRPYKQVYQFEITLLDVQPGIWRRIQVPDNYSFFELHLAIQDSMGWKCSHMHEFLLYPNTKKQLRLSTLGKSLDADTECDRDHRISDHFTEFTKTALYIYDFGDDWVHQITFEGVFERQGKTAYPKCVDGERACPPEDIGGPFGYEEALEILNDPKHEDHEELLEHVGHDFDPGVFTKSQVQFQNPTVAYGRFVAAVNMMGGK